ncbi:MAG TPA: T9SS type A sorting domain-containing protein [Chitinophaga sp.]|nr:T9SS type A sorting domain-containing protein [Chitinophaga sp.]
MAQVNPPVANAASSVGASSFNANWNSVSGATGYKLDVAMNNTFVLNRIDTLVYWYFPVYYPDLIVDKANSSNAGRIIAIKGNNNTITFPERSGGSGYVAQVKGWDAGATISKYWQIKINTLGYDSLRLSSVQRSTEAGPKNFKIQYSILPNVWKGIPDSILTVNNGYTVGVVINRILPDECSNQDSVFIRWIVTDNVAVNNSTGQISLVTNSGTNEIDDILVTGKPTAALSGYYNKPVSNTSCPVSGLTLGATYYYRLRAHNASNIASVSSNSITVTTSLGTPLPVDLISFSGSRKEGKNLLHWSTATEINNKGFELQRSMDGSNYTALAFIQSLAPEGNSVQQIHYNYNDYSYAGKKQYYRLRQVDIDGKSKLSNVVMIRDEEIKKLEVQLYPNPANTSLNVQVDSPEKVDLTCYVKDINGLVIKQDIYKVMEGSNVISISTGRLSSGVYYLQLTNREGLSLTRSFIVQK